MFLSSTSDIFPAFKLYADSNLLKHVLKILWINDDTTEDEKFGCDNLVQQVSLLLPSCLWYQLFWFYYTKDRLQQ